MNNKSVFRPKGFAGAVYMLLCVLSAAGLITYALTSQTAPGFSALLLPAAAFGLHALGALLSVCSRKSGGTWLMSLVQSLLLIVSVVGLAIAAVLLVSLSTGGDAALLDNVNALLEAFGLAPVTETALTEAGLTSSSLLTSDFIFFESSGSALCPTISLMVSLIMSIPAFIMNAEMMTPT